MLGMHTFPNQVAAHQCFLFTRVVISGDKGIGRMTADHLGTAMGLNIPIFVCISKTDLPDFDPSPILTEVRSAHVSPVSSVLFLLPGWFLCDLRNYARPC
jgi:peptide subunit release factor RF-3